MKKLLILAMLILSGCAHDNYSVIPNGNGSQGAMFDDLKSCKHDATSKYWSERNDGRDTGDTATAGIIGGVLGGALGGALAGAIVGGGAAGGASSNNDGAMKTSDIDPYIENCMAARGYAGTSN